MKLTAKIFTSISILAIYIIFGLLFNGNHKWMSFFTLLSTFGIALYLFNRYKKSELRKILLFLIIPPLTIFITLSLFTSFLYTTIYIIFIPIAGYFAYNFFIKKNIIKILIYGTIFCFASFIFLPNQIVYFDNIKSRTIIPFKGLTLLDINKEEVKLDTNKVVVLEFWNTACRVCIEKFPEFEKQYLAYKSNPNIQIYSINVPLKRDSIKNTISLIKRWNYKFPTLFAINDTEIKNYNINSYPHILIIKNNKITYSGRLEFEDKILIYNFKNEIERNLIP